MNVLYVGFVFFKRKTAYEMRIRDWSSDVCSSDLVEVGGKRGQVGQRLDRVRRAEPRQIAVHRHGLQPARAQAGEGEAAEALGQRLAAGTGDQRQRTVGRRGGAR